MKQKHAVSGSLKTAQSMVQNTNNFWVSEDGINNGTKALTISVFLKSAQIMEQKH